ncbi:MAG: hypothetical protein HY602_02630 [Parcubacteria group bacterium]|nr:hypothetical protein [Parcubacteria group bacterium]
MFITLLLTIIGVLLTGIGYFIKRILDNTDKISVDVSDIKPKVKILWELKFSESHSPMALNEKGRDILNKSGIKELVDKELPQLIEAVRGKNPKDAYQVQEFSREVMFNIKNKLEFLPQLQKGAFDTGVDIDSVLLVGSIYLRDLSLPKFNLKLGDADDQRVQ